MAKHHQHGLYLAAEAILKKLHEIDSKIYPADPLHPAEEDLQNKEEDLPNEEIINESLSVVYLKEKPSVEKTSSVWIPLTPELVYSYLAERVVDWTYRFTGVRHKVQGYGSSIGAAELFSILISYEGEDFIMRYKINERPYEDELYLIAETIKQYTVASFIKTAHKYRSYRQLEKDILAEYKRQFRSYSEEYAVYAEYIKDDIQSRIASGLLGIRYRLKASTLERRVAAGIASKVPFFASGNFISCLRIAIIA